MYRLSGSSAGDNDGRGGGLGSLTVRRQAVDEKEVQDTERGYMGQKKVHGDK